MKLLPKSEIKLGWRSSAAIALRAHYAIAFFIVSVSAGFLNSQAVVRELAKIPDLEVKEVLLEHQTVIEGDLTNLAAIDHDDDDIGRKG